MWWLLIGWFWRAPIGRAVTAPEGAFPHLPLRSSGCTAVRWGSRGKSLACCGHKVGLFLWGQLLLLAPFEMRFLLINFLIAYVGPGSALSAVTNWLLWSGWSARCSVLAQGHPSCASSFTNRLDDFLLSLCSFLPRLSARTFLFLLLSFAISSRISHVLQVSECSKRKGWGGGISSRSRYPQGELWLSARGGRGTSMLQIPWLRSCFCIWTCELSYNGNEWECYGDLRLESVILTTHTVFLGWFLGISTIFAQGISRLVLITHKWSVI